MPNYENLNKQIIDNIYENTNNEIKGQGLLDTLQMAVETLRDDGRLFAGIATPTLNPGISDANVFYIATQAGTYTYFGNFNKTNTQITIFLNSPTGWTNTTLSQQVEGGRLFAGVAKPNNPSNPQHNTEVFYLASETGEYTQFRNQSNQYYTKDSNIITVFRNRQTAGSSPVVYWEWEHLPQELGGTTPGGTTNYEELKNKPVLKTDYPETTAFKPEEETIQGILNLHRISKTGAYDDLLNKPPEGIPLIDPQPTYNAFLDNMTNWATLFQSGQHIIFLGASSGLNRLTLIMTRAGSYGSQYLFGGCTIVNEGASISEGISIQHTSLIYRTQTASGWGKWKYISKGDDNIYEKIANIVSANNPKITISQDGEVKGEFTLNQVNNELINLDAGNSTFLDVHKGNLNYTLNNEFENVNRNMSYSLSVKNNVGIEVASGILFITNCGNTQWLFMNADIKWGEIDESIISVFPDYSSLMKREKENGGWSDWKFEIKGNDNLYEKLENLQTAIPVVDLSSTGMNMDINDYLDSSTQQHAWGGYFMNGQALININLEGGHTVMLMLTAYYNGGNSTKEITQWLWGNIDIGVSDNKLRFPNLNGVGTLVRRKVGGKWEYAFGETEGMPFLEGTTNNINAILNDTNMWEHYIDDKGSAIIRVVDTQIGGLLFVTKNGNNGLISQWFLGNQAVNSINNNILSFASVTSLLKRQQVSDGMSLKWGEWTYEINGEENLYEEIKKLKEEINSISNCECEDAESFESMNELNEYLDGFFPLGVEKFVKIRVLVSGKRIGHGILIISRTDKNISQWLFLNGKISANKKFIETALAKESSLIKRDGEIDEEGEMDWGDWRYEIDGSKNIYDKITFLENLIAQLGGGGTTVSWGGILGDIENQDDLKDALKTKANDEQTLTDAAASSTLPATTKTTINTLLQTVRDCLKWLVGMFDTNSGHKHDGTDSSKIDFTNIGNKPTIPNAADFVTLADDQFIQGGKVFMSFVQTLGVNPIKLINNAQTSTIQPILSLHDKNGLIEFNSNNITFKNLQEGLKDIIYINVQKLCIMTKHDNPINIALQIEDNGIWGSCTTAGMALINKGKIVTLNPSTGKIDAKYYDAGNGTGEQGLFICCVDDINELNAFLDDYTEAEWYSYSYDGQSVISVKFNDNSFLATLEINLRQNENNNNKKITQILTGYVQITSVFDINLNNDVAILEIDEESRTVKRTGEIGKGGVVSWEDWEIEDAVLQEIQQADENVLGGIKAAVKSVTDTVEAKIDTASGKLFVPTYPVISNLSTINAITANYTTILEDAGVILSSTNTTNKTVTVPINASVAYPIGTKIFIQRSGTGTVAIVGASGVTVNRQANLANTMFQHGLVVLLKLGTNEWTLLGDLEDSV